MDVKKLFEGLVYRHAPSSAKREDLLITDVITAPRADAGNTLYVCTKTPLRDGRIGMRAAYAAGCRVFLCTHDAAPGDGATVLIADKPEVLLGELAARVHGYPAKRIFTVGVTGTHGKSTTVLFAEQILRLAGRRVAALTSDGLVLNGNLTPRDAIVPDAAELQRMLARMVREGVEIALLELSAYQLSCDVQIGVSFSAVALTALTSRRVGTAAYPDFDTYRTVKEKLIAAGAAVSILPVGVTLLHSTDALRVGAGGEIWAEDVHITRSFFGKLQSHLTLCTKEERIPLILPVMGDFIIDDLLFAIVIARTAGLRFGDILPLLPQLRASGRLECVYDKHGRTVFVDAAYEAEELSLALGALRKICEGRLCVLVGSVGTRSEERRAPLGRVACAFADMVYLTADNPDTEDPVSICDEMRASMKEPLRAVVIPDRRLAILRAACEMRPGDVLLLAGKGNENYQLLGGVREAFSEREILQNAMKD